MTASPLLILGLDSTTDDRATDRFQHSGVMPVEAIQRHANQGAGARDRYNALTDQQRIRVLAFLDSL